MKERKRIAAKAAVALLSAMIAVAAVAVWSPEAGESETAARPVVRIASFDNRAGEDGKRIFSAFTYALDALSGRIAVILPGHRMTPLLRIRRT